MFQEIVFQFSRRRIVKNSLVPDHAMGALSSRVAYHAWRESTLQAEFGRYFDPSLVAGKDVLDFGCGGGELSFALVRMGARSCIGVDLGQAMIEQARGQVRDEPITFQCAKDTHSIDLPDASIDVIACFDVMEHIMEYRAIIREWYRVLKPGGHVLISWQPWFHPYGHHAYCYIPVPWAHLLLNEKAITEVCARVVDLPQFDPPLWDRDSAGKRINRFRVAIEAGRASENNYLNKLTTWRFEQLCTDVGLRIEKREFSEFEGPAVVRRLSRALSTLPRVREFFTANVSYRLKKAGLSA